MEKFDKDIIKLMESIGFKFHNNSIMNKDMKYGTAHKYKYYPDYFTDKHYTLILFSNDKVLLNGSLSPVTFVDHRLYIHKNSDGSYHDSPYQINSYSENNKKYIIEKINKIFSIELRDQKLNELIYQN